MRKGIISLFIGLPIALIASFLFIGPCLMPELNTSFGPFFMLMGYSAVYWFGGLIVVPLLILGLILGIISLREKQTNRIISFAGIAFNTLGLIIGIIFYIQLLVPSWLQDYLVPTTPRTTEKIGNVVLPVGTQVLIGGNNNVAVAFLEQDFEIQHILLPKGTKVEFDLSGKMKYATLGTDRDIKGKHFLKGTKIEFDRNGNIIK